MSTCATMGVMKPVLQKLTALAGDEYGNLKGVRKEASLLEKELRAINTALENLGFTDMIDPAAKEWIDHVREMSFDMENCIDDFIHQIGDGHAELGFIKKTARHLKLLGKRHRIADLIEDFKALALEANQRRIRYMIDETIPTSSFVTIQYQDLGLLTRPAARFEAIGLVAIDGPKEELVSLLTDTEEKLKVVSIVGFAGLGKTTLAKQVCAEIGGQFDCTAFVPVSQRPNLTGLLYRICIQLKLQMDGSSRACELQDIINDIRKHLTHKRYLIVVDDLWDLSAWNIIRRAFPKNTNGSRVIVTTRVEDVTSGACYSHPECIYRMKPLDEQDSKKLFFQRVYGSEVDHPSRFEEISAEEDHPSRFEEISGEDDHPSRFEEISVEILKKCGGLPLAIITIASLLACHPEKLRDVWENIRNSLGAQFAVNPTLEGVKHILNLSYSHLPFHLRPCFLHLGIYPEDYEVERDDLIRQWLAEGYVSNLHGSNMEDVAKSYFNELANRSLIQPGRTEHGELLSCRVHDMMLDLILTKCAEQNFVSVVCSSEDIINMGSSEYKVRRISMNFSDGGAADEAASRTIRFRLSQVRSLALFGESKYMPPLLQFKYLRVILFESLEDKTINLTAISQFFQLRYLKVSVEQHIELPTEMQGLVHLETLDLDCKQLQIPLDIVHLPRISHLKVPCRTKLPKGIRHMKSVRTLDGFDLRWSSVEDIEGLGELTNLRFLRLLAGIAGNFWTAEATALASSIGMLHDLRYLQIDGILFDTCDRPNLLSVPFPHIKVLKLDGWRIPRLPKWIYGLQCLSWLELTVNTCSDEFHAFGELPSLVHLSLWLRSIPEDSTVICSTGSFPALNYCECLSICDVTAYLAFEAGAMPKLRGLGLQFDKDDWGGTTPVGLEHLLSLQHINVHITCKSQESKEEARREAETAFGNCAQLHPSRPSFSVYPVKGGFIYRAAYNSCLNLSPKI